MYDVAAYGQPGLPDTIVCLGNAAKPSKGQCQQAVNRQGISQNPQSSRNFKQRRQKPQRMPQQYMGYQIQKIIQNHIAAQGENSLYGRLNCLVGFRQKPASQTGNRVLSGCIGGGRNAACLFKRGSTKLQK